MRKVTSRPPNVDGRQMTAVGIIKGQRFKRRAP
jgi:hypothetical protein